MAVALAAPTASRPSFVARLQAWLHAVLAVTGQRRDLLALDDHLLADIGLDRGAVRAELRRPFWNPPTRAWRQ